MKTHPILTQDTNRLFAFEIENAYISPRTVAQLLAEIDGVDDVQLRKRFTQPSDVHVQFKYRGQPCIVWEPFGDSSRYWIGPKNRANESEGIERLEAAFKLYKPALLRSLFGDLMTLRFLKR